MGHDENDQVVFKPALNDKQVSSVIQRLADSRKITIDGTKVAYSLQAL